MYKPARTITANLPAAKPRIKPERTGSTPNETPCLICDCDGFRRSKTAFVCTCGHHCEDHENSHLITRKRSP